MHFRDRECQWTPNQWLHGHVSVLSLRVKNGRERVREGVKESIWVGRVQCEPVGMKGLGFRGKAIGLGGEAVASHISGRDGLDAVNLSRMYSHGMNVAQYQSLHRPRSY